MKNRPTVHDIADEHGQAQHPTQIQQRRDREVARSSGRKLVSPFTCKVVGVSFTSHYPGNLHTLDQVAAEAQVKGEPLTVVLERNPANQFDANAIEVHVPALGDAGMIGHLERPIAARMAPEMDNGVLWLAELGDVLIKPDHLDRPGISIKATRRE